MNYPLTEENSFEHSVWLNPIQWGFEQAFFFELLVVVIRCCAEFLSLYGPA